MLHGTATFDMPVGNFPDYTSYHKEHLDLCLHHTCVQFGLGKTEAEAECNSSFPVLLNFFSHQNSIVLIRIFYLLGSIFRDNF